MTKNRHPYASGEVFRFVSDELLDGIRETSKTLTKLGIDHALVGGVAVGVYGHIRATKDIDFLVSANAFVSHKGGIVTMKPGVPFAFRGLPVDVLEDADVADDLTDPIYIEGFPVISPEALIVMKLKALRRRDQEDIEALLDIGCTTKKKVTKYLKDRNISLDTKAIAFLKEQK